MPSNFDIYLPKFNDAHILDPSGDEEDAERWIGWNDQSFDLLDYMNTYWFWLGQPGNGYLENLLAEAEYLVSWSTCVAFRWTTRQDKSFGRPPAKGNRTLGRAINAVHKPVAPNNPAVKIVEGWNAPLWEPPQQIHLNQPEPPNYNDDPRPFAERLQEYREQKEEERKLIKMNKPRRTKPRIAPRKPGYRGTAAGPRKR